MKNVLVVEYSQTGQLSAVLDAIVQPLLAPDSGIRVHRERLQPQTPYPYPWPFWQFMDTFPETVAGEAPPLAPLVVDVNAPYDLIILGYPVWFLSPPPVLSAFLRSDDGRRLLRGRPVVTVTACRNMWVMAQEKIKELLTDAGARHLDHVALIDQAHPLASFITTPRWLMTGRKNSLWGLPPAGVSPDEIRASRRFGLALRDALQRGLETTGGPLLSGLRACTVDPRLVPSEQIGRRVFGVWSRLLRAAGRPGQPLRRLLLCAYVALLITLIITVVPLSLLLKVVLQPVLRRRYASIKHVFELPSGSSDARIALFCE